MKLAELLEWLAEHPHAPVYQCAHIDNSMHLVAHAGARKCSTICGLAGSTPDTVICVLLPAHLVTCSACRYYTAIGEKE